MKTLIKDDVSKRTSYELHHLENGEEISFLIKEFESLLLPCAHCGFAKPVIVYEFQPNLGNLHFFHVWCNQFDLTEHTTHGCRMMTMPEKARDDITSIKEALGIIVETWNRRAV